MKKQISLLSIGFLSLGAEYVNADLNSQGKKNKDQFHLELLSEKLSEKPQPEERRSVFKRLEIERIEESEELDSTVYDNPDAPEIFGPSVKRMEYKSKFPDHEKQIRNIMNPIPSPNNLQVYPFVLSVPFEGGDLLKKKEAEISINQNFVDGLLEGRSQTHQMNIDQWYFEQRVQFSIGVTKNLEMSVAVPLYHFGGTTSFTQNGIELLGLGSKNRNFWGAPVVNVKKQIYQNPEKNFRTQTSLWYQFPEGNQRGRGGTATSHYAVNQIFELYDEEYRYTANLGIIGGGDLKLLNDQVLNQGTGYFASVGMTKKVLPTLALETQLHTYRSTLRETNVEELTRFNSHILAGVRKNYKGFDLSFSLTHGISSETKLGSALDIKYHW